MELEVRPRELLIALKPGVQVPTKVGDYIGTLLSENGTYHFYDASTQSGNSMPAEHTLLDQDQYGILYHTLLKGDHEQD